jgi:hypothetical protein
MVSALCDGKQTWTMRIPAEPDRDPDLVIARALGMAKRAIETLTAERDAAREEANEAKRSYEGACRTVALMFAAATGNTDSGPTRGVVEDVADMKAERDRLAACVERVRGCERLYVYDDEVMMRRGIEEVGADGPYMRAADILAALEGTNEAR